MQREIKHLTLSGRQRIDSIKSDKRGIRSQLLTLILHATISMAALQMHGNKQQDKNGCKGNSKYRGNGKARSSWHQSHKHKGTHF